MKQSFKGGSMALTITPSYPGIFIQRQPTLFFSPVISLYQRTYVFCATEAGDPMSPLEIASMDDFYNQFGSANKLILDSLEFYLLNTNIGLTVVKVVPYDLATVTIVAATPGVYTLTILGNTISVDVPSDPVPTLESITKLILSAINNTLLVNRFIEAEFKLDTEGAFVYDGQFFLRSKTQETFTITADTLNLTATEVTTPDGLSFWDYLRALDQAPLRFSEEPLGIMTCPEGSAIASQWQRNQVRSAMMDSALRLGWFPILDPALPDVVRNPLELQKDFVGVVGYGSAYFPYGIDRDSDYVAPSIMMGAYAMKVFSVVGIQGALAGARFPFLGLSSLAYEIKLSRYETGDRSFMSDHNLNPILFKKGRGYVPYDNKTFSSELRYSHEVMIMNSLERSLYDTLDNSGILFDPLGNRGQKIDQIGGLLISVCQRYYDDNALFGDVPADAYAVICALENQNIEDLQNNRIRAEVYASPSAIARQVLVGVMRVQIGEMSRVLSATGSTVNA